MFNEKAVLLTQCSKVEIPYDAHINRVQSDSTLNYILTFNQNLLSYGYALSKDLMESLAFLEAKDFIQWAINLETLIKKEIGVRPKMKPFFPSFPNEIMEEDMAGMICDALLHYATNGEYKPTEVYHTLFPLLVSKDDKIIELSEGTRGDYDKLFTQKLLSKAGLSEDDKEYIKWYVETYQAELDVLIPVETITHKETLCYLTSLCLNNELALEVLKSQFTNATDVLRLAVALQRGDVSLSKKHQFKSFPRSQRRLFVELLNNVSRKVLEQDLWQRRQMWLGFSQKVHPLSYNQYYKVVSAFYQLHNEKKPATFNTKLEEAFNHKDFKAVVLLLMKRPALFARQLDRVLRLEKEMSDVSTTPIPATIWAFSKIVHEVPTTILLNMIEHFNHRHEEQSFRAFFPKGSLFKAYGVEEDLLEPLPQSWCEWTVITAKNGLKQQYSQKEELGKVYLDEELKQYTVPFAQRSTSKQLKTIARGSRFKIADETKVIRLFNYWKEKNNQRTDLDLSVLVFDEALNILTDVSYFNLKDERYGLVHSGDFVSAQESAIEFVDINLEKIKKTTARYVAVLINSYTYTPFNEIEECFAGYMERDGLTGQVFEPRTVKHKFDLSNSSEACVPFLIDLETMDVIWSDFALPHVNSINNVATHSSSTRYLLKSMLHAHKPNLYDLFKLHIEARHGELVETEEEAEVVFGGETGLQPYDFNEILAEYL